MGGLSESLEKFYCYRYPRKNDYFDDSDGDDVIIMIIIMNR